MVTVATWVVRYRAHRCAKRISITALNAGTRFLIAAMAVQSMVKGLSTLRPGLDA
jgi:small neutral amino acid transporter SnatA (MarC family)